jgi:hypothetical protein
MTIINTIRIDTNPVGERSDINTIFIIQNQNQNKLSHFKNTIFRIFYNY